MELPLLYRCSLLLGHLLSWRHTAPVTWDLLLCLMAHLRGRPCAADGIDGAAVGLCRQRAGRLGAWAAHRGIPAHLGNRERCVFGARQRRTWEGSRRGLSCTQRDMVMGKLLYTSQCPGRCAVPCADTSRSLSAHSGPCRAPGAGRPRRRPAWARPAAPSHCPAALGPHMWPSHTCRPAPASSHSPRLSRGHRSSRAETVLDVGAPSAAGPIHGRQNKGRQAALSNCPLSFALLASPPGQGPPAAAPETRRRAPRSPAAATRPPSRPTCPPKVVRARNQP